MKRLEYRILELIKEDDGQPSFGNDTSSGSSGGNSSDDSSSDNSDEDSGSDDSSSEDTPSFGNDDSADSSLDSTSDNSDDDSSDGNSDDETSDENDDSKETARSHRRMMFLHALEWTSDLSWMASPRTSSRKWRVVTSPRILLHRRLMMDAGSCFQEQRSSSRRTRSRNS